MATRKPKKTDKPLPPIEPEFPVWTMAHHMIRNAAYPDWQAEILEQKRLAILFMQEHGLLVRQLIEPGASAESLRSFILRWGDLTPEGQDFFRRTEKKGIQTNNRGRSVKGLKMYERELKKLREEQQTSAKGE